MNHSLIFNVHSIGVRRPSGPYRIATILRDADWDVEVVEYAYYFKLEELKEFTRSRVTSNTVFIGFSCFFYVWNQSFDEFVLWLKKEYPNIKTIVGGQSRQIMSTNNIDYYVHGYGEHAILEIIKAIVGNTNNNLSFDPLFFGSKKVITANHSYPAFPMKSLKIKYEIRDDIQPWDWLTLELARGCIFQCTYCNFPVLGVKDDHTRSAEDFEEEIKENYERWGVTSYYIADETFNDYSAKINKFAEVIDRINIQTTMTGFIRADLLVNRKQDWDSLIKLGFWGQFYGVETMNHASAKAVGKGMNPIKLRDGLLEARKYFKARGPYRGSMGIVVGLPHETIESQLATFDWLYKNWGGEATHVWALEIPISDPKKNVLSKLATDFKKYGYRESSVIPQEVPAELVNAFGGESESRITMMDGCFNWQNDHMNYADACRISDEWTLDSISKKHDIAIGALALGYYASMGTSLQHVVDHKKIWDQPDHDHDVRIREYINKKLSS
jgi:radical SAM superfamily enzyme YgiQ (UPF0313 family)